MCRLEASDEPHFAEACSGVRRARPSAAAPRARAGRPQQSQAPQRRGGRKRAPDPEIAEWYALVCRCERHRHDRGGGIVSAVSEWQRCRSWITAALKRSPGFETIEDGARLVSDGTYQFWRGRPAAPINAIGHLAAPHGLIVPHAGGAVAQLIEQL